MPLRTTKTAPPEQLLRVRFAPAPLLAESGRSKTAHKSYPHGHMGCNSTGARAPRYANRMPRGLCPRSRGSILLPVYYSAPAGAPPCPRE
eukprot:672204-Lingulodinium_polyedra.AAC.1